MVHVQGRMEWEGVRVHRATQNGASYKTYELFVSGIFWLIFSDHAWPQVTETVGSEPMDTGGLL